MVSGGSGMRNFEACTYTRRQRNVSVRKYFRVRASDLTRALACSGQLRGEVLLLQRLIEKYKILFDHPISLPTIGYLVLDNKGEPETTGECDILLVVNKGR